MRVQCDHSRKGGTRSSSQRDSVLTRGVENVALPSPHFPEAIILPLRGWELPKTKCRPRTTDRVPIAVVDENSCSGWRAFFAYASGEEGDSGLPGFQGQREARVRQTVVRFGGHTWKSSKSSGLYSLGSVSEFSGHHCSSSKQVAESKSLASSWERSSSGKSAQSCSSPDPPPWGDR